MWPPSLILHPTDFSRCSEEAFELACQIAAGSQGKIVVLHACAPMLFTAGEAPPLAVEVEKEAEAKQLLQQIKSDLPNVQVEHRLESGMAADCILETARTLQADLIIMGTHGRRGLNRLILGSVAELVLRRADCPVMTVKPRRKPAT